MNCTVQEFGCRHTALQILRSNLKLLLEQVCRHGEAWPPDCDSLKKSATGALSDGTNLIRDFILDQNFLAIKSMMTTNHNVIL